MTDPNDTRRVLVLINASDARRSACLPFSYRYDPTTGQGAIGVEFAGTAVTSGSAFGTGIQPAAANAISEVYVTANDELQWSEGSYRGFFTLTINTSTLTATYYAMENISPFYFFPFPALRNLIAV